MSVGPTLITGAAGDIGAAVVLRLAADGVPVLIADLPARRTDLEELAGQCREHGAAVAVHCCDVRDRHAVEAAVSSGEDDLGPLQGLVNCAGVQGPFERVDRYDSAALRAVIDINLIATFEVTAVVAAAMIASGARGAIVNLASMAGVSGAPNMPAYSAAKAGVIGFTKSAAKDLAPDGIRVNAVSPAFIGPGRMWDVQTAAQAAAASPYYPVDPAEVAAAMVAAVPLRRLGRLEEVAAAVRFLLSDEAAYITGVNLEVSGGAS